jgi:hypothetical protein
MDFPLVSRVLNATAAGAKSIKSFNGPVGFAKTACSLGLWIPQAQALSARASKRISFISGTFEAVSLAGRIATFIEGLFSTSEKMGKWGLSILKKGCEVTLWADWCGIVHLEESTKNSMKGASSIIGVVKSSISLWNDYHADSKDRNWSVSVPKFLTSSLLVVAHLTDSQKVRNYVKLAAKAFEGVCFGYRLYNKGISYNPAHWSISLRRLCKVISLISVSAIGFYVLEKTIDFDSFN